MDTPSTKTPISLDDFGGDEEPASAPQTPPTPLDKIVEDVEDGWEDALVLPEVEIAPDPIVFPEEEDVSTFLCRQPLENGVTRYVVQRGFTVEEKVYKPGDIIPVQCRFCVLWNREWLGKTRCHPGRILSNSTIMSADKFSCERYFV